MTSDLEIIIQVIESVLEELPEQGVQPHDSLIGEERLLDSMALVEVCLQLEDLASESGFIFDWMSESAMSRSRSMFKSVETLANEFTAQRNSSQ